MALPSSKGRLQQLANQKVARRGWPRLISYIRHSEAPWHHPLHSLLGVDVLLDPEVALGHEASQRR